ncbi:3-oxoacyl-[acyl-carrier protein] reductase [Peptoclostridium litorale DSM 5388]|uniref:3-oxoacyl-[acyl-carrier-protein] reductase FabG n=1 Tax=Peptoclostridium litorale DSM 5388 TaxID=1121324 RepID=A0A069RJH4_PEPLI|nr:SDR family oxidoreductase [Peptoclostridium litorale]KDR94407.1 3-oxoacyl-[acyl-carrier-protein] reductase FabG [Peptoclostridium litorale DSM 5388]SIO24386.1 3-oxoacyl-[acyl-carrier protein] reductase [Peptoclostridium litorale DSM 5388]
MNIGKTVLVTGGSKGIGKSIAEIFAYKGYRVVVNYNSSAADAKDLVENLKSCGMSAESFKADVSNRTEVDSMVDFCIEKFGSIDVLINNAGISDSSLFTDITEDEWDSMMNVNLKGVFNCTQSALRYMLPVKKGKVINISSMWGLVGGSCEVHYSAAKAGVIGLTKALAKELGPSNIQVNCIAPGVIQTDMLSDYSESDIQSLIYETPLMRIGKPQNIAHSALFLSSDESDFITGQVLSVNGGFVI